MVKSVVVLAPTAMCLAPLLGSIPKPEVSSKHPRDTKRSATFRPTLNPRHRELSGPTRKAIEAPRLKPQILNQSPNTLSPARKWRGRPREGGAAEERR